MTAETIHQIVRSPYKLMPIILCMNIELNA